MAKPSASEDPSIPLGRLPPGRHGLPRDFVAANHRERLIVAGTQEIVERGYAETTVANIIKAAAVSRRTFYEHFDSKEACFLAVYDLVIAHMRARVVAAFEGEDEWPLAVRAGLAAFLRFFAEEPQLARICLVEPLAAGRSVADRHRAVIASFVPLLQPGRGSGGSGEPPPQTEGAVVAGIAALVTMRVVAGQTDRLEALLPDVVEAALAPFVGSDEADRVARL
jgi:AcrR family transcriptional regulator